MAQFHIFWTAILMLVFVLIVIWAWSSKRKSKFEQAAQLPLAADEYQSKE